MVGNFQDVQRPELVGDARSQQLRVDLLLDVAGEHDPPAAEADVEHDRDVVDASARIGRSERHGPGQRPFHVHPDPVEPQGVTRGEDAALPPELGHAPAIRGVAGASPDHPRLGDLPDPVAVHHRRHPGDMVLVRVGQNHQLQPPVPRRNALVEKRDEPVGVGASVDQGPTSVWALKEDGVTLADIEHRHVQTSVGPRAVCGDQQGGQAEDRTDSHEATRSTWRTVARLRRRRALGWCRVIWPRAW